MAVSLWRMALYHLAASGHSQHDLLAHQNAAEGFPHTPEIECPRQEDHGGRGVDANACAAPRSGYTAEG